MVEKIVVLVYGAWKINMRYIIWWFRSLFCNHNWKFEESDYEKHENDFLVRAGTIVSATCKKCGWHRSYWKF